MPEDLPTPRQSAALLAKSLRDLQPAVPLAIEQIDVVLRLITAARERIETFLNLGCGNGMLAAAILEEQPQARAFLQDWSESALHAARLQLRGVSDQVEFHAADCASPGWVRAAQRLAPFDTIISAGGVHALPDERKRAVYGELLGLLKPGGLFVNIEPVSSATRWTESPLEDYAIDAVFGDQLKGSGKKSRAKIAREYYARLAQAGARLAPLEVQCDWLRELGFESVDVYLKVEELAIFGGQKPGVG